MTLLSQCCRILKGVDEFSITAVVLTVKQIKGLRNCSLFRYTVTDTGCRTEHAESPSNSECTVCRCTETCIIAGLVSETKMSW